MAFAPKSLREIRISVTSSFLTNHLNSATDSWALTNTDIHKIRALEYDDGGLKQDPIEDAAIQVRMYDKPAPIAGLRLGSYKFSMPIGGEFSNIHASTYMNFVSVALGGIALPTTQRSAAVSATGSTTSNVAIATASSFVVAGQAILGGVRGDGRMGGEVRPIANVGASYITPAYPFAAAPVEGDPVIFSTTAYPDEDATQLYMHSLGIGYGTSDQRQTISGVPEVKISKLGIGELPQVDFEMKPADWQDVPAGDRATASSSAAYRGTPPAFDKGMGFVHFDDLTAQTRNVKSCGDFTVDPGIKHESIPGPAGINGITAWQRVPAHATAEFKIVRAKPASTTDEDMPGLNADYVGKVAKRALLQFGHSNGKCVAIEIAQGYIAEAPTPDALGAFAAVKIKLQTYENSAATTDITRAGFKIHGF